MVVGHSVGIVSRASSALVEHDDAEPVEDRCDRYHGARPPLGGVEPADDLQLDLEDIAPEAWHKPARDSADGTGI